MKDDPFTDGEFDDLWPRSGPTGAAVTGLRSLETTSNAQRVHYMRPSLPSQSYIEFDCDEDEPDAWWCVQCDSWHVERERTDAEMHEALAAYKKADAEWRRTGGVHLVPGPVDVRATFECEDGCVCTGVMGGPPDVWLWSDWSTG